MNTTKIAMILDSSKVKTKTEFFEFADVWYQRTKNLLSVIHGTEETKQRINKARRLHTEMMKRVMVLNQIAIRISQPMRIKKPVN